MRSVREVFSDLRKEWSAPREVIYGGLTVPLVCQFNAPLVENVKWSEDIAIPSELKEFWGCANGGELFKDDKYGQWGLRIFSASRSLQETMQFPFRRQADAKRGDCVVGEFLGDLEQLIVRCDSSAKDFGALFVSLPLDVRGDWYFVAGSFGEFLDEYARAEGEKFWIS